MRSFHSATCLDGLYKGNMLGDQNFQYKACFGVHEELCSIYLELPARIFIDGLVQRLLKIPAS